MAIEQGGSPPVLDPATESKQDDIITAIEANAPIDPVGLKDTSSTTIDPATEGKQDDIISNQTDGTQKTQIVDSGDANEEVDVVTATDDNTNLDGLSGLVDNSILNCRIDADTVKPARMDASTHTIQQIDYEHHEIHGGSHFFIEDFVTLNASDTLDIVAQTPDTTEEIHLVWELQSQKEIEFEIYEDATITYNGTDLTARNNNRRSANTTSLVNFEADPTVTDVGTLIAQLCIGDTTNPNRGIPGGGQRNRELILKRNSNYIFRITSLVNDNCITYLGEWYEHTPKD